MATGDPCTCTSWMVFPSAPPAWMQARAVAILHEGHPDGYAVEETGEDGGCYRYVREEHPPEPSIPFEHPGVTVYVGSGCTSGKAGGGGGAPSSSSSGEAPSLGSSPPSSGDVTCDD
jgi:hypothetical protein